MTRYTPEQALDLLTAAHGEYDGSSEGVLYFVTPDPDPVRFTSLGDPVDVENPWPTDEQGRPYAEVRMVSADRDPEDPEAPATRFRIYAEPIKEN